MVNKQMANKDLEYWDVVSDVIHPSQKTLSSILNAVILLNGRIEDFHSSDIKDEQWIGDARSCCVEFRISLPVGKKEKFEEMTGFKLKDPPKISLDFFESWEKTVWQATSKDGSGILEANSIEECFKKIISLGRDISDYQFEEKWITKQ